MIPPWYTLPCHLSHLLSTGPPLCRSWSDLDWAFYRLVCSLRAIPNAREQCVSFQQCLPGELISEHTVRCPLWISYHPPPYTLTIYDIILGLWFNVLLPSGSPQEMFISPLENVTSVDLQNPYVSLAHTNTCANSPHELPHSGLPASTYLGSPVSSDFSLPLYSSHTHAQTHSHHVLETLAPQVQAKGAMTNLDVEMAVYTCAYSSTGRR